MNEIFKTLPLVNTEIESSDFEIKKIFDGVGDFCGFYELKDSEIAVYDKFGRLLAFFVKNESGNTVHLSPSGVFEDFTVSDNNLVKYDKTGKYQGYYIVSENGNVSEYNSSGDFLGYYVEEYDEKLVKYDALGRRKLVVDF